MMGCPSDLQIQGHKVLGSLRGLSVMLITMVSSRSRSRVSSTAAGVVGSCK